MDSWIIVIILELAVGLLAYASRRSSWVRPLPRENPPRPKAAMSATNSGISFGADASVSTIAPGAAVRDALLQL